MEDERPRAVSIPDSDSPPVTLDMRRRRVTMYAVTEDELDGFVHGDAPISLALFGVTAGGAITALVTLLTVNLGTRAFAGFVAATVTAIGLTLLFGARALMDYRAARRRADKIRTPDRIVL